MTKRKYKRKMIAAGVFLFLFAALFVFLCVWFFGASYETFDAEAREEVALPDLSDGFVPQGACALPADGPYRYAVSGYYKEGVASRIYLLGEETASVTLTRNGAAEETHFGGVAATERYLYLASDGEIVRVALEDLYAAAGGAAEIADSFETGIQNAFCFIEGDTLYAGEFYRAGNYETDSSHHIRRDGETNRAFVYLFRMDETKEGGVESTAPYAALSVRGLVQGIAVTDETIVLSCSWGLADSELVSYSNPLGGETDGTCDVNGASVPLYFLGSARQKACVVAPSMSEGIFLRDGRLCVLFESGCNKYKTFVRRQTRAIMSLPLGLFE